MTQSIFSSPFYFLKSDQSGSAATGRKFSVFIEEGLVPARYPVKREGNLIRICLDSLYYADD
jgi:hypothetical protein